MAILALRYTTATDDEGFESLLRIPGDSRAIHVADMHDPDPHRGWQAVTERRQALPERHTVVGSGSALFVLNPEGNGTIDTDPRVRAYLERLLFELVEFTNGKHKAFFGICFSAQALSVAVNALLNLIQNGINPQGLSRWEEFKHQLDQLNHATVWETNQPMALAGIPEFGVLPSAIEDPKDPLFAASAQERRRQEEIQLIHMNRQVILADPLETVKKALADRLRVDIVASREVPVGPQLTTRRVVTALRITRALDGTPPSTREAFYGTQPHPEWIGPRLAEILEHAMARPGGRYHGYMGLPETEVAQGIESIRHAPEEGRVYFQTALRKLAA